jgi:cytochrome c oxidase assembly protein subunit 15
MTAITISDSNYTTPTHFCSKLSFFTKFHVFMVSSLIFLGALVKSHEAGLTVPDWPTSFGQNMFLYPPSEWTGGIFYEHTHRLLASFIGLLTVILAVWCGAKEKRRWVRVLSYLALGLVIFQGALGGLTVLLQLPPIVSIAHGVTAQTFLALSIIIAYAQSHEFTNSNGYTTALSNTAKSGLIVIGLLYFQLILGALMRHTGSGLAIPDFPTMAGSWFPLLNDNFLAAANELRLAVGLGPTKMQNIIAHLAHRLGAVVVTIGAVILFVKMRRHPESEIRTSGTRVLHILTLQWIAGISAILSVREPYITSFHVVMGAILLGVTVLATLKAWRFGAHC